MVKHESHDNTECILDKEKDVKKVNKLLEEINSKIWDYCFECGKPLTKDMKEDEDWFNINNCGESFPQCAECFNKNSK